MSILGNLQYYIQRYSEGFFNGITLELLAGIIKLLPVVINKGKYLSSFLLYSFRVIYEMVLIPKYILNFSTPLHRHATTLRLPSKHPPLSSDHLVYPWPPWPPPSVCSPYKSQKNLPKIQIWSYNSPLKKNVHLYPVAFKVLSMA